MKTVTISTKNRHNLEIGKQYHIWNGFAKTLDDIWFNNCTLLQVENTEITELLFRLEDGKEIWIDCDFIEPYDRTSHIPDPNNHKDKCYMFIPKSI